MCPMYVKLSRAPYATGPLLSLHSGQDPVAVCTDEKRKRKSFSKFPLSLPLLSFPPPQSILPYIFEQMKSESTPWSFRSSRKLQIQDTIWVKLYFHIKI